MITSNLSPPSTHPHDSLLLCQKCSFCLTIKTWFFFIESSGSPFQDEMLHPNPSSSQISVFGSFRVVNSANPIALFSFLHSWSLLLSPSTWVPLSSHSNSSSKHILSELLSLAYPHHSSIIYRPFNDKRRSGKKNQTQHECCKSSLSSHLQKRLLTSVVLQDKVGQCLSCRAPQTLLVPNKYC